MSTITEYEIMQNWQNNISNTILSICCTTFNHDKFIEDTLDSFLMQKTNFIFEIIIRDDASTDETATIIKAYTSKYPNIIKPIFEKENTFSKGIKPMPAAIKVAKGTYIAICEGDDYWTDPLKLQKQVNFLEKNKDYVLTYASMEAFDENGIIENFHSGATYDLSSEDIQKCVPINTLTACFRNIIKIPKEHQCSKYGDLFLWSLLGSHGKGKYLQDIRASRYRVHSGGVHSTKDFDHQFEMLTVTYVALYIHYFNINNKILAKYFKDKIHTMSFRELETSKLNLIYYKEIRRRIKYKIKKFFKKFRIKSMTT